MRVHLHFNYQFFGKFRIKIQLNNRKNKEERYSQEPRLSDTRYSAKQTVTQDQREMEICKQESEIAMQSIGIDETNTFKITLFF